MLWQHALTESLFSLSSGGILITEAHILPSGSGWGIIPNCAGNKSNVKSLELLVFHHVYAKCLHTDAVLALET